MQWCRKDELSKERESRVEEVTRMISAFIPQIHVIAILTSLGWDGASQRERERENRAREGEQYDQASKYTY